MKRRKSQTRIPAEWERHDACWMAWPHRKDEWDDALEAAQEELLALARGIQQGGDLVKLLMPDPSTDDAPPQTLVDEALTVIHAPYGDCWTRDTAPVFADDGAGNLVALCFRFNGWGKKFVIAGDADVASFVAIHSGGETRPIDLVFEGGAMDVDGRGSCLLSRSCLLHPNRNPNLCEADIEATLDASAGIRRVLWLDGVLEGDHTDGHVDTLARFVAPGMVVCAEPRANDPNARVLRDVQAQLREMHDSEGRRLVVRTIPSAGRFELAGELLPASYCNFYIANHAVLVPQYGTPEDEPARQAIDALFPNRKAIGLSARALIHGGGAFHCVTQQQPRIS